MRKTQTDKCEKQYRGRKAVAKTSQMKRHQENFKLKFSRDSKENKEQESSTDQNKSLKTCSKTLLEKKADTWE